MTHSIQLYPIPISTNNKESGKSLDQANHQLRTCHSTWDPKRNAIALAVVPSNLSSKKTDKKPQNITSVPDQSIYLINANNFKPTRRSFITRSYEVFSGLQRVVQLTEEEEGMIHDQIYLPGGVCLPSTSQLKYYYRIGNQYIVALKDYVAELQKEDEIKNGEEIDLALQMIDIFSLFVLVHIPADGRGDGIVVEEILDWVNRTNPQPPKEEGEELSAMNIPYEHVNYWPYIQACVIRGHLTQASALLKPYTKTHNPTLNQLMTVLISLIKSTPRSTSFNQELEFNKAVEKFRENVERSLITLESEMNIIFENERIKSENNSHDSGIAFDEEDLIHFQASYKILLEILSGDQSRISETCYDWQEALGAHLLWVNPFCKRDDLPLVMKKITTDWPIDQTSNLDLSTSSILNGEINLLLESTSKLDKWLICHLADLVDKLGISTSPGHSRGYHIHEFVEYLSVDQGLWRLMIAYLNTVQGSRESIREILRRLVVDDLDTQFKQPDNDNMDLDSTQPAKLTTKVSILEMKSIYAEYDMEDELNRTARILSRRLMKQRKFGAAVAYAVTANDLKLVSRISDCLLDEYLTNGPEEFARLVDEIPSSLLHPTAPSIRPGLFFDSPVKDNLNEKNNDMVHPNLNSSKLLFLSRYRDMHSYYSKGERKLAAQTLIALMTTEIAPKRWWAVCLIDVIPLLEDDEILISLQDTYELFRCLEEITGPIVSSREDSYDNLRYLKRIVRNGRRSLSSDSNQPSSKAPQRNNQNNSKVRKNNDFDQDDDDDDGDDGTRSALEQLNVVKYALSRHLSRGLTWLNGTRRKQIRENIKEKMTGEKITTISPNNNQPILERVEPTKAELEELLENSSKAFKGYSKETNLEQRQTIIKKALEILSSKQDELARELTEQMGRPIAYTAKEIQTAIKRSEYLIRISNEIFADTPGEPEHGFKRYIRKDPVGPILVIFAWNYPYLILVNSLIPALLAGNSVILKPSPQTPTIAEHIQKVFLEAGLPKDVISYFHSGGMNSETGKIAIESPLVKLICFTGSVQGGLAVQKLASDRVVPVSLELGGKDPAYIRNDVDLDWAASEIVDGALFNSGQSCCSVERVYVHHSVHDQFIIAIQNVLKTYIVGDPFDPKTHLGPVISPQSKNFIQDQINEAIQAGAKDVTPPNQSFDNLPNAGNFIKPTLLVDVDHKMRIMKEETFGPVIAIMSVQDDQEAIQLMNDSEFGLTASIWTKDLELAELELSTQIEAGTVFVNRCDFPAADLAWIGWKNSGKGLSLSKFGFDQFIKLKSIHIKSYPK
ncbi:hypothetical protein H4Q26_012320 [Puccinia striiformis f. sp. tritici PST-130]|nr:hypothetical protein H4Q26_012320 [Puccinia striiformis f. sp. tritici PST-130]